MANENRYYKTPFAESGDKTEVPNTSTGGSVGYDTGFGPDYELPQGTVNRKRIERDMWNGLQNGVTGNLKQWQENLYPTWIEDNGDGVAFSYSEGMIVSHNDINYVSLEGSNQEEPGTGNNWNVKSSDINDLSKTYDLQSNAEIGSLSFPLGKKLKTYSYDSVDIVYDWIVSSSIPLGSVGIALPNGLFAVVLKLKSGVVPQGNSVIDMHYGVIRGAGFLPTETGSNRLYTVLTAGVKGDRSITLTANSDTVQGQPLVVNQLITYKADNNEYYTAVIESIASNVINIASPLEEDLPTGDNVTNFYANSGHPNIVGGYYAIADHAIRSTTNVGKITQRVNLATFGDAISSPIATNANNNPGSSSVSALDISSALGTIANGVAVTFTLDEIGSYEAHIKINPLGENIRVAFTAGAFSSSVSLNENSATTVKLSIGSFNPGDSIFLAITGDDTNNNFYVNEEIQIVRTDIAKPDFETGTHVLLGDSWFAQSAGGIFDRLVERFPQATFINAGVGGNTAAASTSRFEIDVAPFNPDYVWFITGTNDYGQSVTPETLSFYLNRLKTQCSTIGAHLLTFNSSVGASDNAAHLNLSRRYIAESYYFDEVINVADPISTGSWMPQVRDDISGNVATVGTERGDWSRVGNMVTAWFSIVNIDTTGLTAGNTAVITGLPFADAGGTNQVASGLIQTSQIDFDGTAMVLIGSTEQHLTLYDNNAIGTGKNILVSDLKFNGSDIFGQITYRV